MTWDHLGLILGHLEATLELSSESWRATWVQGHVAEAILDRKTGELASVGFTLVLCIEFHTGPEEKARSHRRLVWSWNTWLQRHRNIGFYMSF